MSNSTFHSTTPGGPSTGYGANAHTAATAKSALVANGEKILFDIQNVLPVLRQVTITISHVKTGTANAPAMLLATLPQKLLAATTRTYEQNLRDSIANGNAELITPHYRKNHPRPKSQQLATQQRGFGNPSTRHQPYRERQPAFHGSIQLRQYQTLHGTLGTLFIELEKRTVRHG
jgi:hypothetical protein